MFELYLKKNGFTLIEILVAIAVSGIIITAVFGLLLSGFKSFNFGSKQSSFQQDIRLVENIIKNKLRNAYLIKFKENNCSFNTISLDQEDSNSSLYYFKHNNRKVTDSIFKEIHVITDENLIKFKINIENKDDSYKIQLLLNNFSFENNINKKLTIDQLCFSNKK